MTLRLLIVCWLSLLMPLAHGATDELLLSISERLSVYQHISGQFTQSREVSFLKHPLVSTGSFSLDREDGLDWLIETPVQSHMQVRNGQVILDGVTVDDPGIGQFMAMILQAFMNRDLAPVAERFDVSGEVGDERWQLRLQPRQWLFRKAIERVELDGAGFLQRVTVYEPDGSATHIEFDQVSGDAAPVKVGNGRET